MFNGGAAHRRRRQAIEVRIEAARDAEGWPHKPNEAWIVPVQRAGNCRSDHRLAMEVSTDAHPISEMAESPYENGVWSSAKPSPSTRRERRCSAARRAVAAGHHDKSRDGRRPDRLRRSTGSCGRSVGRGAPAEPLVTARWTQRLWKGPVCGIKPMRRAVNARRLYNRTPARSGGESICGEDEQRERTLTTAVFRARPSGPQDRLPELGASFHVLAPDDLATA
jgi:hypothetical protein